MVSGEIIVFRGDGDARMEQHYRQPERHPLTQPVEKCFMTRYSRGKGMTETKDDNEKNLEERRGIGYA
jgi:hypothetical protein